LPILHLHLHHYNQSPQPLNCKENAERNVEILGGGPAIFLASVRRGGAAGTEIASWGAAGIPAIGAGRADMWRSRAVCRLRAQAGRARARVKPSESAGGRPAGHVRDAMYTYLDMGYGRLVILYMSILYII
jgi:hypothetical protein